MPDIRNASRVHVLEIMPRRKKRLIEFANRLLMINCNNCPILEFCRNQSGMNTEEQFDTGICQMILDECK